MLEECLVEAVVDGIVAAAPVEAQLAPAGVYAELLAVVFVEAPVEILVESAGLKVGEKMQRKNDQD